MSGETFYIEATLPDGRLVCDDNLSAAQLAQLRQAETAGRVTLTHVGPALMSMDDMIRAFGGKR